MGVLNGVLIAGTTYQEIDRGLYLDTAQTVAGPKDQIRVVPGAKKSPSNADPYMLTTFIVTREFDIITPSEGSSPRQKVSVRMEIKAGLDVALSDIQTAIDACSQVPDSDRLTPIFLGAS